MTTAGIPIAVLVAGSTLLDASAAGAVLFGGRGAEPGGSTVGLGRLGRAMLAIAAAFLVKVPILWTLEVRSFGWIHLIYADLVVLLPALGATLWLGTLPLMGGRPRWRLTGPARLAATAALALAPVGFYATWVEPFRLRVESARLDVSGRRAGRSPVRLGVIADIQTDRVTDHERRAVDLLMAQRPDLILIPGDLFQGMPVQFEAARPAFRDLLGRLRAPGGVYMVLGDTDGPGDHLRSLLDDAGIRLLVNEAVTVELGDRRLTIGGVELNARRPASRELIERMETDTDERDVRILLAHRPDVVLGLRPGSRIDLVVAGHTHGGQIVVPGFGPPMTLSSVPRSVAAGGLHRVGRNPIYVGRGVGHERGQAPRIRLFCPPEVAVVEVGSGETGPPADPVAEAGRAQGLQGRRPEERPSPGSGPEADPATAPASDRGPPRTES